MFIPHAFPGASDLRSVLTLRFSTDSFFISDVSKTDQKTVCLFHDRFGILYFYLCLS